jgi:hypothetical protein
MLWRERRQVNESRGVAVSKKSCWVTFAIALRLTTTVKIILAKQLRGDGLQKEGLVK